MPRYLPIRSYDNYVYANLHLGLLKQAEIKCHLKDEYTLTIDPLLSPAMGGIKLMVQEGDELRANALLDEAQNSYLATITCPVCGETGLTYVKEIIHHTSFLKKIRSLLINGQEEEVKNYYRCMHCQTRFNEIPVQS